MSTSQDASLLSIVQGAPASVPDVVAMLRAIDALLSDSDGLKWFNWLYLQVTEAVNAQVSAGGAIDQAMDPKEAAWLAELDVRFASLYFDALRGSLSSSPISLLERDVPASR